MVIVKKQRSEARGKKTIGRKPSVFERIQPIGFDADEGIKINLYGRSGTGKTTLWATFPKPILAIIRSGGRRPGELRSIDTPEYRKTIKQVTLEHSEEIDALCERSSEFGTIVLDHASGLQDLIIAEIIGVDKLPEQMSWGLVTQQQYGQLALQMKERLRNLLDLPNNVVIVAQEREFNMDREDTVITPYVASALTPSVVLWLNPACDYIAETFIRRKMESYEVKIGKKTVKKQKQGKGVEYCLRVAPHDIYMTKFRIPKGRKIPEVLVDPTYEGIMQLIQGVE